MVDVLSIILMLVFGIIAGVAGGLLGIGGCSIMLPALYFLFSYPLPVAIGTTITAVIITATSGAIAHIRMKNVDYGTAKVISASGAVGAVLGSLAFGYLVGKMALLSLIVGLAFLYTSVRMVYEGALKRGGRGGQAGGDVKVVPGSALVKSVIGFFVGILTGIVGLGGGYALVPSFIYILNSAVKIAVGTSLASFIVMSVISASFKVVSQHVDVVAAVCLGAGTAVGAQVGARFVPKTPAWAIKLLFGLIFLYVSLRFILKAAGIVI